MNGDERRRPAENHGSRIDVDVVPLAVVLGHPAQAQGVRRCRVAEHILVEARCAASIRRGAGWTAARPRGEAHTARQLTFPAAP